jgi:hypothetical protein
MGGYGWLPLCRSQNIGSPPRPFRSGESQRGSWVGTVDKAQGNLPVQVQIGIDRDVTVRVKGLALEQNFLAGGL